MINPDKNNKVFIIDSLGLLGIGFYIFCSSLFTSNFAKLHIELFSLGFPIFIGEILLFVLFILFLLKLEITHQWRPAFTIWAIYLGWVLMMTYSGYAHWGPLAFRNAALFYYVSFALLGYSFLNVRILNNKILVSVLVLILAGAIIFKQIDDYFWYTGVVLIVVFILKRFASPLRYFLIALTLVFSHLDNLFLGSRAHMVGIAGAVTFLVFIRIFFLSKFSLSVRIGIGVAFIVLFVVGSIKISDGNAVKSLINWRAIFHLYKENKEYIKDHSSDYNFKFIPYKLFKPNSPDSISNNIYSKEVNLNLVPDQKMCVKAVVVSTASSQPQESSAAASIPTKVVPLGENQPKSNAVKAADVMPLEKYNCLPEPQATKTLRSLETAYDNILFRIFIWEDMLKELRGTHLLTGVGFGEPQRSPSLEILGWADSEWSRDGWITPHNFYLHVIYRTGVIGILLILCLLAALIYLTKIFIGRKDGSGILLISILIYWCVQSTFSVTMELPYYAILFWSLFGMIFAYSSLDNTAKAK